jgi:hypothetical protein
MTQKRIIGLMIAVAFVIGLGLAVGLQIHHDYHPSAQEVAQKVVENHDAVKSGLPTSFVFVEDRGNGYCLFKDEFGYYLVWKDDLFAQSVHITWLGKVRDR